MSSALQATKAAIREDFEKLISQGIPIDGETLPTNFHHIEVRGKSVRNLQIRVCYRDRPPYYFTVAN